MPHDTRCEGVTQTSSDIAAHFVEKAPNNLDLCTLFDIRQLYAVLLA